MRKSSVDLPGLIKRVRLACALTQVELASGIGVTATSIHRYEAGTSTPGAAVLRDLLALASQHHDLDPERALLEQALRERTAGPKQANAEMKALFDVNRRNSLPPLRRPLLDVNVLVSLSQTEHDILEAALALARGRDETAKRVLFSLLRPWLPDDENGSTQLERADPK